MFRSGSDFGGADGSLIDSGSVQGVLEGYELDRLGGERSVEGWIFKDWDFAYMLRSDDRRGGGL